MKTRQQRISGRTCQLAVAVGAALIGMAAKPSVAQQGEIRVLLNGSQLDFGSSPPIEQNNRVLVPMRRVFEALGARVDYDPATQRIRASNGASRVRLQLGSTQAFVNDQEQDLDVPAQSRYGRTLVPLRFVSEAMGADVKWNEYQSTVYITTGSNAVAPPEQVDHGRDNGRDHDAGQAVEFNGRVTSVDPHSNLLMVRTGRDEVRTVHCPNARDFRVGDDVHVTGNARRGIVHADTIIRR